MKQKLSMQQETNDFKIGEPVKTNLLGIITEISMRDGRVFYRIEADGLNYSLVEEGYMSRGF